MYKSICRDLQEYALNAKREAKQREANLRIAYPDKSFDEEGPVKEWERKWVNTGWVTPTGQVKIKRSTTKIRGSRVIYSCAPWAWYTPGLKGAALIVVHRWIMGHAPINRAIERSRVLEPVAAPEDTVVYVDGAYDQAGEGGTQKGGFGVIIVQGGDGGNDENAFEVMQGWGQVTTNKASPVYIGATEHTNNTAELTALAEAMCWLLDEDAAPNKRVLLRPDSEYAAAVATGLNTTTKNNDLCAVVRSLYKALITQRSGQVSWAHVKGHSKHKWNDIVDELAKKGTTCGEYGSGMPGTRWDAARADADLWHLWEVGEAWATEARMRIHIHWDEQGDTNLDLHIRQDESHLTWIVPPGNEPSSVACLRAPQVSEITRILRTINTKDAFGSLNLLPSQSISDATLSGRYTRRLCAHCEDTRMRKDLTGKGTIKQ